MDRKFLDKYQIQILDSNKRCVRHRPVTNQYFTDPKNMDLVQSIPTHDSEPLLTITIPQSRLQNLEKVDELLFHNHEDASVGRLLEIIMEQKAEERRIRENNAGVQEVYEHYSTLLHLSGWMPRVKL